jgi:peptidoglycan/LPS O-acetylase OafA/YrhL
MVALSEQMFTKFPWRKLNGFGNLSFGIYLLHFPLQLAFVGWALSNRLDADFFMAPSTMAVFFVVLILLSNLSYRFFERPTMILIRGAWQAKRVR